MITIRTWKNLTFSMGLAWLLYGAMFFSYPDWDIGVSLLMAGSTYLTADRFLNAVRVRNAQRTLLWSAGAWWSVDGSYWIYWSMVDSSVAIRAGQWPMSLCLYLLCGLVWTGYRPESLPRHPPLHPADRPRPDPAKRQNATDP